MDNTYANRSIHCTVDSCRFHNDSENYCSLESINVSTHEKNPTEIECTDCASFMCKDNCMNCK